MDGWVEGGREEGGKEEGVGGTAVSFGVGGCRMCIPGDNRGNVLGLQCTGDEGERRHKHTL